MTTEFDTRDRAWSTWRDGVRTVGGPDTLLHFDPADGGSIDLTSGHPGGLAQLLSGRVTKLSNLIREDRAYHSAMRAMVSIDLNASQLSEQRGIDAINMAVGLASWHFEGEDFSAPVLIQPVALRQIPGDFEIRLSGRPSVNPALASVLRESFGVEMDADSVATLAVTGTSLDPHAAIDHLVRATRGVPSFVVAHRTVLATLSGDIYATTQRMNAVAHPVLDALAHVPGAAEELAAQRRTVGLVSSDERPLEQDTVLLDCTGDHERILAQIAAGTSILVQTIPGGGITRLVSNAVARLAMAGKRVAVVASGREALRGIESTLTGAGLPGMAVTGHALSKNVIAGILRNERAASVVESSDKEALSRIRSVLVSYRDAFLRTNTQFGVTIGETLNELARLSLLPHAPLTKARLDGDALRYVAAHRSEAGDMLQRLAELGEFAFGPAASSWYGAHFDDPDQAKANYVVAKRLHETDLPELRRRASALFDRVEITPATSLSEMGDYIAMLLGIRESLDRFLPEVFDRPLDEIIIATDPVQSDFMSSANRRRLRHLAKEYVRPGMHVSDMNVALKAVKDQRDRWMRVALRPKPPASPSGIGDLHVHFSAVASDIKQLARVVDQNRLGRLVDLPLDELASVIKRLSDDVDALSDLRERTEIRAALKAHGLEPLVEDCAALNVVPQRVRLELEQAWWQSVYGYMLADEPALLGADTSVLTRLESDFARLDADHVQHNPQRLASALSRRWQVGIENHPREAQALKNRLKAGSLTAANLIAEAPRLATTVAPVWLLSPYTFAAQVPAGMHFDAVVFVDGASIGVAESVLPIAQSSQVIVFGDPAISEPTPFTVSSGTASIQSTAVGSGEAGADVPSLFSALSGHLPRFALTQSYRRGGRGVVDFVNTHFYDRRISALPSADEVLGFPTLEFVHVERGNGIPDPVTHIVEAVPAEISAVVELVLKHATWRPRESLMVVSASSVHARRVRAAVREELKSKPHLAAFFAADQREPFVVLTAEQAATRSRDHVIFTVGYGRTPHGRVLSDFGELSGPHGRQIIAAALTRARRSMTVVSCFTAKDLNPDKLDGGASVLAELYNQEAADEMASAPAQSEPLLVDLANRLDALGAFTSINYGGELDLVAYHGKRAIVIETDNAYARGTLRETIRLRPELLERLGWSYRRVYTFDLFSDPQRIADEIAIALGVKEPPVPEAENGITTSKQGSSRRAHLPGAQDEPGTDEAPFDESAEAWGDRPQDNDEWLLAQRPPHWG